MLEPTAPSARERLRPTARSILGLLAGFSAILLLWIAGYVLLLVVDGPAFDRRGNPVQARAAVELVVASVVASLLGGTLATRLAQRGPFVHALLLSGMQGVTLYTWAGQYGDRAPGWFPLALIGGSVLAILIAGARTRALGGQRSLAIHSPTT